MDSQVIVQLIATGGLVLIAVIQLAHGKRLKRIGQDAKEAREQTANTHSTNLREDLDNMADDVRTVLRHHEHLRQQQATLGQDLGLVMETFERVHDDIRGVRHDINGLREDHGEIRRKQRLDAYRARRALRDHIDECAALQASPQRDTPTEGNNP